MKNILVKSSKIIGVGSDNLKKHNKKIIAVNYGDIITDKKSKILEIGFGWNAVFLEYLNEKGFENLSGLDIDKIAYEKAKSTINKNIKLYNIDIVSFLEKNNSKYDVIIMRHLIEHIEKELLDNIINTIHGNLNKGGILIIETPNVINELGLDTYNRDYTHQTPFSPETLMQSHYMFNSKRIVPVNYPILNYTSTKHLIGSFFSIIISRYYNFKTMLKSFSFGNKGPYTMNMIGIFKK